MATVKEQIKHLQTYSPDKHLCMILWGVGDILEIAQKENKEITQEQAENILELMERHHDATIGITWDTISAYLDQRY